MINPRYEDPTGIVIIMENETQENRLIYTRADHFEPELAEAYRAAQRGDYGPVAPCVGYVPTAADVEIERDRRFSLGAPIDLGDGRAFTVDIDNTSKINIMGLMMAGAAADFRDRDNVTHALSTADIASLGEQAMARVSAIYAASWAIKALDPIPADYADDGRWPT